MKELKLGFFKFNLHCFFGSTVHFSLSMLNTSFSCNQTSHQTRSYILSIKHHLHNYTRYFNNLLINHWQWIQVSSCSFWHVPSIDTIMVFQHNLYFQCTLLHLKCSTTTTLERMRWDMQIQKLRAFTHLQLLLCLIIIIKKNLGNYLPGPCQFFILLFNNQKLKFLTA